MPIFPDNPLGGDLALVLYAGVVFYTLLFGATLLSQWLRSPLRKIVDARIAWSVFFFGAALNSLFFIMSDFYFVDESRVMWIKAGYLSLMIALLAFFFALERILPYRTKHVFSVLGVLVAVATVFWPGAILWIVALTAALIAFTMLGLFFLYFVRSTTGEVRASLRVILFGFLVGCVGFVARSDFIDELLGRAVFLVGEGALMTGLLVVGIGVLGSPALDELDWADQLLELYVIQSSGILLYHHRFVSAVDMDEHLTAAGIAGVQALFQEITNSATGLNNLSVGNYSILFAHGDTFTTVLLAKKPYRVLLDMVGDFSDKFELVYAKALREVTSEMNQFEGARDIVKRVFLC